MSMPLQATRALTAATLLAAAVMVTEVISGVKAAAFMLTVVPSRSMAARSSVTAPVMAAA